METTRLPARAGYWTSFLLACVLLAPGIALASYTLEGCRNNGGIALPNGDGNFICPNAAYTTGNLGKGWNELDLVPFRTTVTNSGTYTFAIVLDNENGGNPGYDVISAPVLNTLLSVGSCSAASSGPQQSVNGINGVTTSIYRLLTITQAAGSTCVYDWYGRLALGSHNFSGSSLHANLLDSQLQGGGVGNKEVSIPVNQISPQSLSKDMSAVVGSSFVWNLTKSGSPSDVSFGDVCASSTPTPQTVAITITWTKSEAVFGKVNITTNVYATNPSSRSIQTTVTDVIYKGTDQSLPPLDTSTPVAVDVPAGQTVLVLTHTVALDTSVAGSIGGSLNDVATATYMDAVTGVPIPGDETATASTQIKGGTSSDSTADLTDSESITGTGLSFSVAAPLVGSFSDYTPVDQTIGPVDWAALAQGTSGSVTFNKTIYLDSPLVGDLGTLSDTAHLYSPNQDTPDQSLEKSLDIGISSSALVKLTVSKTIPANYFTDLLDQSGDTLKVHFSVSGTGGYTNTFTLTFDSSHCCTLTKDLTGLTPDTYTVTETSSEACLGGVCTTPATPSLLAPDENDLPIDLNLPASGNMTCAKTAVFTNSLATQGVTAQVQKITAPTLASNDPDYNWSFTLNGPGLALNACTATAGAGAGFVLFRDSLNNPCLLSNGPYIATETLKTGWTEDYATPHGTNMLVCTFTVDLFADDGMTKSCTFHNTKRAHASLFKTKSGVLDTSASDSFEFQLRQGASLSSVGTILPGGDRFANLQDLFQIAFSVDLTPGQTYQFCEIVMPGWKTSLQNTFVPNGNDPLADSSVMCVNFTPGAGQLVNFNVDNTPPVNPLSGRTIGFWKNWASCSSSFGKQHPILDQTLAAMDPTGVVLGQYFSLHAGNCQAAVYLLSKTAINGVKKSGDPIFNMVAQMIGVELNIARGDQACGKVVAALSAAQALLTKYHFVGTGYTGNISKADQVTINNLATEFDNYNNDKPIACQ